MKGIIMKKGWFQSIVMTNEGTFVKTRTQKQYIVGEQIDTKQREGISMGKFALITASLVLVFAMAAFAAAHQIPSYQVSMDVNPSLTFHVNTFNRILNAEALNEDSQSIPGLEDLRGMKLNQGIKEAISRLTGLGFLEENSVIVISVLGRNNQVQQITRYMQQKYSTEEEDSDPPKFEFEVGRVTQEMFDKARELDVPVGRMVLIAKAMENGADIMYEDALLLSVQEIQRINKLNANIMRMVELQNQEQGLESNVSAEKINRNILRNLERIQKFIDKEDESNERAAEAQQKMVKALEHALQRMQSHSLQVPIDMEESVKTDDMISQTEAERIALTRVNGQVVKVELDRKDLEYEIYIIRDGVRHEITIHAVTGQILGSKEDSKRSVRSLPANIISQTEAARIALTRVNGQVVKVELDREDLEYEIYIIRDGVKHEIKIDAVTGQILESKAEQKHSVTSLPANIISQTEAARIALTNVNGQVVKVELDAEDLEYEIYIIRDGVKHEITIHAVTGQILKYEIDEDEDRSKSQSQGR